LPKQELWRRGLSTSNTTSPLSSVVECTRRSGALVCARDIDPPIFARTAGRLTNCSPLRFASDNLASGLGYQAGGRAARSLIIQPWAVALAVLFSTLVGRSFGWYPALRASRLAPIEAIRTA